MRCITRWNHAYRHKTCLINHRARTVIIIECAGSLWMNKTAEGIQWFSSGYCLFECDRIFIKVSINCFLHVLLRIWPKLGSNKNIAVLTVYPALAWLLCIVAWVSHLHGWGFAKCEKWWRMTTEGDNNVILQMPSIGETQRKRKKKESSGCIQNCLPY